MKPRYPIRGIPPRRPKKPSARILNWQSPKNLVFIILALAMIPAAVLLINALAGDKGATKAGVGATPTATPARPAEDRLRCVGDPFRVTNLSAEPEDVCCRGIITAEVRNNCNQTLTAVIAGQVHDIRTGRVTAAGLKEVFIALGPGEASPFTIEVDLRSRKSWEMLQRNELYARAVPRIAQ